MQYRIYKLIILLAFSIFTLPAAYAQDLPWNHYQKLTDDLLVTKKDQPYDFTTLRGFYTQSAYYDPGGQKTVEALAASVQAYTETTDHAHLIAFDDQLRRHLGNLGVVNFVRQITHENPKFGSPKFLDWIAKGLLASVLRSGNGQSLANSYNILNLGEEAALIQALGLDIINRQTQKTGVIYYGIYDTIERKSGRTKTIFVDLTTPLLAIEKQLEAKQEPLPFF